MVLSCAADVLSHAFYRYGKLVGRHPLPFFILPPCIAFALMLGAINIELAGNAEYLFIPHDAPSLSERDYFKETYLFDDAQYYTTLRRVGNAGMVQIHTEPKNEKNVLRDDVIGAVKVLDTFVLGHAVRHQGATYQYTDLCASWNGVCIYSAFLQIVGNSSINDLDISYPVHVNAQGHVSNLIHEVGGVYILENGVLASARSILLQYFVRFQTSSDKKKSEEWLNSLRDELLDYNDETISVKFKTSLSLNKELDEAQNEATPLFGIAFIVLITFTMCASLMFKSVRSKPWVALGGLVAALLGIVSSVGVMSAAGVKFASIVVVMPFLILGESYSSYLCIC